jgi:DNA-binding GntR family transcriptional regulator
MSTQIQESWPTPETMVDGITDRLRRAIITGAIRPKERIRVADLERKFGVSHIPIREALRRLQSEASSKFHRGERPLPQA